MSNSRKYTSNFIKVHAALGMDLSKLHEPSKSKYKNKKVIFEGITFDSKKELVRYKELLDLESQGKIQDLEYHKVFKLLDSMQTTEGVVRGINYECDFFYYDFALKSFVAEDLKSSMTQKLPDYIMKKKLMLFKYPDLCFFENSTKTQKYYRRIYEKTNS